MHTLKWKKHFCGLSHCGGEAFPNSFRLLPDFGRVTQFEPTLMPAGIWPSSSSQWLRRCRNPRCSSNPTVAWEPHCSTSVNFGRRFRSWRRHPGYMNFKSTAVISYFTRLELTPAYSCFASLFGLCGCLVFRIRPWPAVRTPLPQPGNCLILQVWVMPWCLLQFTISSAGRQKKPLRGRTPRSRSPKNTGFRKSGRGHCPFAGGLWVSLDAWTKDFLTYAEAWRLTNPSAPRCRDHTISLCSLRRSQKKARYKKGWIRWLRHWWTATAQENAITRRNSIGCKVSYCSYWLSGTASQRRKAPTLSEVGQKTHFDEPFRPLAVRVRNPGS